MLILEIEFEILNSKFYHIRILQNSSNKQDSWLVCVWIKKNNNKLSIYNMIQNKWQHPPYITKRNNNNKIKINKKGHPSWNMGLYLSSDVAKIRKILHVKRDLPTKPYNCATRSQLKATLVRVLVLCAIAFNTLLQLLAWGVCGPQGTQWKSIRFAGSFSK